MKFVATAQTALTEGAAQVAAAAKQGSEVLSTGLADALAHGQKTVTQMASEFAQITSELGALAGPLSPSEIAGDLAPALSNLQSKLQAIPRQLASVGSSLVDAGKSLGDIPGDLHTVAQGVGALPARLVALHPDLSDVMPGLNALLNRVQALSDQAQGVQPRLAALITDLQPLQASILALQNPTQVISPVARQQILIDLRALAENAGVKAREGVNDISQGIRSEAGAVQVELSGMADGLAEIVEKLAADITALVAELFDLLKPIQLRLVDTVDTLKAELQNMQALIDGFHGNVEDLAQALNVPIDKVKVAMDGMAQQILAVGVIVDGVIGNIDKLIAQVQQLVQAILDTLDQAAAGVDRALDGFKQAIKELIEEIDNIKAQLAALPERFSAVTDQIDAAQELIEYVRGKIADFVQQADRALVAASAELDQAGTLCDEAITICTRYQMRAPTLMVARTMFMGVK